LTFHKPALPRSLDWLPVADALAIIQKNYSPLTALQIIPVAKACGSILAEPLYASRANPPVTNSAVDGYGFSSESVTATKKLRLLDEQVEPGIPFKQSIPKGGAVKILTGSQIPEEIDTIIMQEDATIHDGYLIVNLPIKKGSNIRGLGEDIKSGERLLAKGHRITASDLATLIAAGITQMTVYKPLKVAVLSTGSELASHQEEPIHSQVIDTNRPLLLSMIDKWGFEPIDLGKVIDCPERIRERLDHGTEKADVILTSGGASSGSKDYISSLLRTEGKLHFWYIAVKPGRPLIFANWNQTLVFGLPGNPIAAFVCTLIFGLPLLKQLAGQTEWKPQSFMIQASFNKSKKPGRIEYWRARINADGFAEVFASEGSGLTTSLLWSNGLVEVAESTTQIQTGDLVKYFPYSSFELL